MPTKKKGAGRPKAITPKVVSKLEEAFKIDATVEEACAYAGIAKATYYRELERRKGFRDEMERARNYPFMLAKATVMKAVQRGDGALAFKWLERRQKDLYRNSIETCNEVELFHIQNPKREPAAKTALECKAIAEANIAKKQEAGLI